MTFTVDDLVASFNAGGHIGQEAIDIANLQTQLAQTLAFAQQQQQQQQHAPSSHKLCNTPTTARTPTTTFGNWSAFEQQQHRARSRSASIAVEGGGMDTVDEDTEMEMEMDADEELAVEELLASPRASAQNQPFPVRCRGRGDSLRLQHYGHNHAFAHSPASPTHTRHPSTDPISVSDCGSPVSSSFSSDPFCTAAAAEPPYPPQQTQQSFFAQIGKPSQHSPFFVTAQANTSSNAHVPQNQFNPPRFVPAGMIDS